MIDVTFLTFIHHELFIAQVYEKSSSRFFSTNKVINQ